MLLLFCDRQAAKMFDWILYFFIAVTLYYWLYYLPPKGYPPGPFIKPFIGSFPSLKNKQLHFYLEKLRDKYGPVTGFKLLTRNIVMVSGPKEAREVLKNDKVLGRPDFTRTSNNPRQGIIFSDYNDHWKDQRSFALRQLREFGFGKSSMQDAILQEFDEFARILGRRNRVKVTGLFNTSTVNVLWAMMSGKRFTHGDPEFTRLLDGLDKTFHSPNRSLPFLRSLTIVRKLFPKWAGVFEAEQSERDMQMFFEKAFAEHKENRSDVPRDFIDAYLAELDKPNHKQSFSEKTMMAVCMDLFAGGAESAGNSLGFCILYFILYPEWQEKVFQEIDSVYGKEGKPRLQDRKELPQVEAFISEVFRANTIAPIGVPRRAIEDTYIGGYFIPENTIIFVSQWCLLQDKQHWRDPDKFRPDRFINEDGSYRKDDWLINFGDGKRQCIGDTFSKDFLFIFLIALVQKFEFRLPDGHPKPSTICAPGVTTAPQAFEFDVMPRS